MKFMNKQAPLDCRRQMVNVSVENIKEYPFNWTTDLRIIYVLNGHITIEIHKEPEYLCIKELGKGGVFLFGHKEIHRIYSNDNDNQVLVVSIDEDYIRRIYDYVDYLEFDYPESLNGNVLNKLRDKILTVAYNSIFSEYIGEYVFSDMVERFISWTIDNVEILNRKLKGIKEESFHMNRLRRIDKIIKTRFSDSNMVNIIAEQEHLNKDYISKEYKLKLDYNFRQLMNFYRTQEAIRQVLTTDKSLHDIATECGFSAGRYMNKEFCKFYKDGPKEFREKNKAAKLQSEKLNPKDVFNNDETLLQKDFIYDVTGGENVKEVCIDFLNKDGQLLESLSKYNLLKISYTEIMDTRKRALLEEAIEKCGIKSIYTFDLLSAENIHSVYDIISFFQNRNIEILVETAIAGVYKEVIKKLFYDKNIAIREVDFMTVQIATNNEADCFEPTDIIKSTFEKKMVFNNLVGGRNSIFTPIGNKTHIFYVNTVLSKLKGNIVLQEEDCIVVKDENILRILMCNPNKGQKTSVSLKVEYVEKANLVCNHILTDKDEQLYEIEEKLQENILLKDNVVNSIESMLAPSVEIENIKGCVFNKNFKLSSGEVRLIEIM